MIKNMIDNQFILKRCENILANICTKLNTSDGTQKEESIFTNHHTLDEFPITDLETIQKVEHQLKTNESYKNSVVRNFVEFYII